MAPRWLILLLAVSLLLVCSLTSCSCGDDDDDDNDNDGEDDDDDDDDHDDDILDDDDDDTAPTGPPLWGPVDMTGDGALEYLYLETNEDAGVTYFAFEVRSLADDTVVWSDSYSEENATLQVALADFDADGAYEIAIAFNFFPGKDTPYKSRAEVLDGNDGFASAFATGELSGMHLTLYANRDWNRDGVPELCLQAAPMAGGDAWLRFYDGQSDYALATDITGGAFTVTGVVRDDLWGPADMDGDGADDYLYLDKVWEKAEWYYDMQVRRAADHTVIKQAQLPVGDGTMTAEAADLDLDGTTELILATNYTIEARAKAASYEGKVEVLDGDEDFNATFTTGLIDDYWLYPQGNWDYDRDGLPELMVQAVPHQGRDTLLRFYEASSAYELIKEIAGRNATLASIEVDGLRRPANVNDDANAEYVLVEKEFVADQWVYTITAAHAKYDVVAWEQAYPVTTGGLVVALADLDEDVISEIVVTVYDTADGGGASIDVWDGNDDFANAFHQDFAAGYTLTTALDWDFDRDNLPEMRLTAAPLAAVDDFVRFYEPLSAYEAVHQFSVDAGRTVDVIGAKKAF
ncbi:MAG TPA: hypothetical protein PKW95_08650 [bacterium]|nr:hypothetical protein [bacterium]